MHAVGGGGEACGLHVRGLVSEDCPIGLLVVHVAGEVPEDIVSVDVGAEWTPVKY